MVKQNFQREKFKKNEVFANIFIDNICKQNQGTSFVYITRKWKLCILLITSQLTVKFGLIIINTQIKHLYS